jgi:hypothetical protein
MPGYTTDGKTSQGDVVNQVESFTNMMSMDLSGKMNVVIVLLVALVVMGAYKCFKK